MKHFLENTNTEELELIQNYMDEHHIDDPDKLTEADYEIIEESKSKPNGYDSDVPLTLMHMLKFKYQPSHQSNSWLSSIYRGCRDLAELKTAEFNKLKQDENQLQKYYNQALNMKKLYSETGLDRSTFPKTVDKAFGDLASFDKLRDVDYVKKNFIDKYATDDMKDIFTVKWGEYVSGKRNK